MKKTFLNTILSCCMASTLLAGCASSASAVSTASPASGNTDSRQSMMTLYKQFGISDGNTVCSPLSIYLALSMLADCTADASQQQLLTLLEAEDTESLKQEAQRLYRQYNFQKMLDEDGAPKDEKDPDKAQLISKVSDALFVNQDAGLKKKALKDIEKDFNADVYSGVPGTAEFDKVFRDWLNEATNNLLQEQADGMSLDPDTVLALASAIYYKAPWVNSFSEYETAKETFHSPDGDIEVDMMHEQESMLYAAKDAFTAVALDLHDGSTCWIILPKEGRNPSDLKEDEQLYELLESGSESDNVTWQEVSLSLPKMDITSEMSLVDGLQSLGITDVFEAGTADFTPLSDSDNIFVSEIQHDAGFTADEDGVEAAAFTVVMMEATSIEEQEPIEFTVDRPFLFAVTGMDGTILFGGSAADPQP